MPFTGSFTIFFSIYNMQNYHITRANLKHFKNKFFTKAGEMPSLEEGWLVFSVKQVGDMATAMLTIHTHIQPYRHTTIHAYNHTDIQTAPATYRF